MSMLSEDPPSPCIGVCQLHPQAQICEGCFRTVEEIAGWMHYRPEQKRAVLEKLPARGKQLQEI